MERQFLNLILFTCLILSSCQQLPEKKEVLPVAEIQSNQQTTQIDNDKLISYYSDIWDYILMKSSYSSRELDEQTLFYMNQHLKDVDKFKEYLNDSYYFLFFVIQEIEKADLPIELAFLPYIESNYDPFSISSSGAVGMWQFMPRTGRLYELERSWWNEDRHDPFRSTEAAIKYLKYLYQRFDNDLYHTLAAYNAGPSFLDRQIKKNQRRGLQIDFWSLDLPAQTKNYVPKFIALKELIFNANQYEIELPYIPYEPVVAKIEIPGQVEVLTLSEYLNIKPELLYKLNAGYTKWASAPSDKSIFYVPIEKFDYFQTADNPFDDTNQINWISHIIQRGDNLWSLAEKYDTEVRIIKEVNFLNADLLTIGATLLIPLSKAESNYFIPYEMHIVSEGDTLWNIANKYNLEVIDLARMNSINVNSYLQLGQQLSIGNKDIYRNMESKKRTILYSVKQGDNLYKISELFDVSVKSIKDMNKFNEETLRPGQIIKIAIRAF
tara:strand:+ start:135 stop:1616 length:1482 start_codon:yes stop_codon:yes gene_type:complete